MFVVFEEDGGFKLGRVLQDQTTSFQIESLHGKRLKVKRANVLLEFKQPELEHVHHQAQLEQQSLEVSFLWETCPPEAERHFSDVAEDYYGRTPAPAEALAILETLHSAPMYFHRKGKGLYRAAPESSVKAALAGLARRAEEQAHIQRWQDALENGQYPTEWTPAILNELLYKPEKQQLHTKAIEAACQSLKTDTLSVLRNTGIIPSSHDYHLGRFLYQHFPKGSEWHNLPALNMEMIAELPEATVQAISLDDANTTEVDDAFSLRTLASGTYEVGIHIAAPALLITPHSEWDALAQTRYSTVYMPGHKITMLPDCLVDAFSLNEGRSAPALSLYITCNAEGEILSHRTAIERVAIAANLRHEYLPDQNFDLDTTEWTHYAEYADTLKTLYGLAEAAYLRRGKLDQARHDFSFHIEHLGKPEERVVIESRERGSRPDRLVSEWMIIANTVWSGALAEQNAPAFYRVQVGGKVKSSSQADAHQGLNVPHYMWSTSPLRRYADLLNQQQLIAHYRAETLPYQANDSTLLEAITHFDTAYAVYRHFQDQMEHYWCLRWLAQEQISMLEAKTLVREHLVRLERLPLVVKVSDLPTGMPAGTRCWIRVDHIDLWGLQASWHFSEWFESTTPCEAASEVAASEQEPSAS